MKNILFIDIETVACASTYQELPDGLQAHWNKKATAMGATNQEEVAALFPEKAGIFAEFGKIVAIALGYIKSDGGRESLQVKGWGQEDEATLLHHFKSVVEQFPQQSTIFCAHNGKEFDYPYLCRRLTLHQMPLPPMLNIQDKKPWEIKHLDTMELWKFGDYKRYTSLDLLATLFGIPSSKEHLDGSKVNAAYYQAGALEEIVRYCCEDVVVTCQLLRKLRCMSLIPPEEIHFA